LTNDLTITNQGFISKNFFSTGVDPLPNANIYVLDQLKAETKTDLESTTCPLLSPIRTFTNRFLIRFIEINFINVYTLSHNDYTNEMNLYELE
jgi:hypothetical protein